MIDHVTISVYDLAKNKVFYEKILAPFFYQIILGKENRFWAFDIGNCALFEIAINNKPIGFIQYYQANKVGDGWWPNEVEGTIGIDQFIGEKDLINRGIGTKMIRAFIDYLFRDPNVKKIITDVNPKNLHAIRCYEKVGFEFVKVIMTPDGLAHLMMIDKRFSEKS